MKFTNIRNLKVTESTNADAMRAAEAGEPEGLVIWARQQTAGRGRLGRVWVSPEGNLYVSALLRPHCSAQTAAQYSFVAALAIYDAVRCYLPHADIKLKWPNDVLVGGKKISGILVETAPLQKTDISWLVIGIGLNIVSHPDDALYPATSLQAAGATRVEIKELLDKLLERLGYWHEILKKDGFAPLCAAWLKEAQKGHLLVKVSDQALEGEFARLNELGNLVLRLADGSERSIATGDVLFGSGSAHAARY